ncbi:SDR family oxidoreductase [Dyella subtropica]|uniref:SDR family oxidoreductase n=1 Tax=Dyella subtropica TaxID=2992127 RepID=UPI002254B9FA|nr:SDR family oxidoreductase [Dyella subtropica]
MKIQGTTALVTGANRGLGQAFAKALLEAGATKVYAAARDPSTVTLAGATPIKLDVTRADDVFAAAKIAQDVSIVINNAGIALGAMLLSDQGADAIRKQLETNLFGMLNVSQAFAPVLRGHGGGALVNMLSVLSWASLPSTATYSISKAAAWALTNGLRNELREHGTKVVAVHAGFIDTDMAAHVTAPKSSPADIAARVIQALLNDEEEVLADDISRQVKAGFGSTPSHYIAGLKP